MALGHVDALDHDLALLGDRPDYDAPLAPVLARDHLHRVVAVNVEMESGHRLEHLRSQGNDFHEVAVAQLAGHRPENPGAARVVLWTQDHGRVLVEPDRRAVLPAELTRGAHDHRLHHFALLDLAARGGHGDCSSDHVADARVLAVMTAHDANAEELARPSVVRNLQTCFLLDHDRRCLLRLLHNFDHPKTLVAGKRTGFHDPHPVADRALVLLVVGLEAHGLPDHLLVAG